MTHGLADGTICDCCKWFPLCRIGDKIRNVRDVAPVPPERRKFWQEMEYRGPKYIYQYRRLSLGLCPIDSYRPMEPEKDPPGEEEPVPTLPEAGRYWKYFVGTVRK